eukprot:CAMPEP_0206242846 /NCGR_PEP_ID=MMETSP0047_2-20121206/17276_1 /ASSEMBLY_ACC=CAM_ASM_000192 /TAXON_ID=195065 /ORGANISM="Chroomonas mesostigmatica_cf, Strain CCMP1168" /LENGTH=531 /DNA_ID=CAMNT_0053667895 /DNA_START=77 /DNA_END=1672 /DNA_ORIENTATION=+
MPSPARRVALPALACIIAIGAVDAFVPTAMTRLPGRTAAVSATPSLRASRFHEAQQRKVGVRMLFFDDNKKDEVPIPNIPTFFPPAERIVAVGDVHGDVEALRGCLKIAKLIDDDDNWIGGKTHFVQIGDILDRGDEEKDCIDVLLGLQEQAREAGGNVTVLLGNHEIMNVELDFRYVTPGAWDMWGEQPTGTMLMRMKERLKMMGYPEYMRSRINAFKPGGHIAKQLATMQVAVQIGDTVLVHGGLRRKHVEYGIDKLNGVTSRWLSDGAGLADKPDIIDETDSPVWARLYSVPSPTKDSKEELQSVLETLNAQRMIVGHTPQLRGINSAVTEDGYEVWRCDTGMSRGMMSGPLECIEILQDGTIHILTKKGIVPASLRSPEAVGEVVDVCDLDSEICTPALEETQDLMLSEKPTSDEQKYQPYASIDMIDMAEQEEITQEMIKLRSVDDKTLPTRPRLQKLVETMIADAVSRDDRSLTKKKIRECLTKIVGRDMVAENRPFIYETVDVIVARYLEQAEEESVQESSVRR